MQMSSIILLVNGVLKKLQNHALCAFYTLLKNSEYFPLTGYCSLQPTQR